MITRDLRQLTFRMVLRSLVTLAGLAKFGGWRTRCAHEDELIRNASVVVWLIRNAIAHNILDPIWNINDPQLQNKQFPVADVLVFDTTGLNGNPLKRFD